jgi:hypothetical protein
MCFGHNHIPHNEARPVTGSAPRLGSAGNAIYGRVDGFPAIATPYGTAVTIAEQWTRRRVTCRLLHIQPGRSLELPAGLDRETILIVEDGSGDLLSADGRTQPSLSPLDAIRAGPDAVGAIRATRPLRLLETSMQSPETPKHLRDALEVKARNDEAWKLYEYEALGQEVFTPQHEGAIGLLRFMFPQDEIPVHVHPSSGRIIRPIAGKGYTYIHPDRCPMDTDTIAAFDSNVIHTNGPLQGETYELWAVQLPWVASGIDTQNIAGHENFVRYVAEVPVPDRYKTRDELLLRAHSQRQRIRGAQP